MLLCWINFDWSLLICFFCVAFQVNRALEDNLVKAVNGVHPVGFAKGAVRKEQQVLNRVMNVALVSMRTTWGKRLVYRAYQEHLHKVPVVRSANSVHLDGSVTIQKALLARVVQLVNDH